MNPRKLPAKTNAQKELLAVESGLGVDGLLALAAALTPPGAELLKSSRKGAAAVATESQTPPVEHVISQQPGKKR